MPEELKPEYEGDKRPTETSADQGENAEPTVAELIARLEAAEARAAAAEGRTYAAQTPLNLVPEHAGGPGLDIAPTWSQAEQEAARLEAG